MRAREMHLALVLLVFFGHCHYAFCVYNVNVRHIRYNESKISSDTSKVININNDDIFSELSHVWRSKIRSSPPETTTIKSLISTFVKEDKAHLQSKPFKVSTSGTRNEEFRNNENIITSTAKIWKTEPVSKPIILFDSALTIKNDSSDSEKLRNKIFQDTQKYWTRLKGILENMKSIIKDEFSTSNHEEKIATLIIDKITNMVDNLNIFNKIKSTVNPHLIEYLSSKWDDTTQELVKKSPILTLLTSFDSDYLSKQFLYKIAKNIAMHYGTKNMKQFTDLSFVNELMKTSGFFDKEIQQIFEILGVNQTDSTQEELSRMYRYGRDKNGYEHSGYAPMPHYGYGMAGLDPFVLLAGLAFASFLAFLLFRILSNPPGKRRSVPDISLAMERSDMPDLMNNIYNILESADKLYSDDIMNEDMAEILSESANNLWTNYQKDREGKSYIKKFLCGKIKSSSFASFDVRHSLQQIFLSGLSTVFGEPKSARYMDELLTKLEENDDINCDPGT